MSNHAKTVFVGLSGGVDSSVAAARLKASGFTVIGVFIKVWHPDFLDCNWEAERLDAMRVAAHLDIPFLMCNAEDAYKNKVADYFISEYAAGRTPNPDVMCNKAVKFGVFLDFALKNGADFVATGHYAQVEQNKSAETKTVQYKMLRGIDANKDQSYFLWTLTQEQLQYILLPIGDTTKDTIRREAEKLHIPVATKKDSQGVCFLGHIDIPDFLSHFIELKEGNVLDTKGNVIGKHKGALVYTLGQRHGFEVVHKKNSDSAYYVTERNIDGNTITVSTERPCTKTETHMTLHETNYIAWEPVLDKVVSMQTRYRQRPVEVKIKSVSTNELTLSLCSEHEIYAVGQSCVLYKDNQCIGGGIIAT